MSGFVLAAGDNTSLLGQAVQFIFWTLVQRGFPTTSVVVKLFFQVITISVKSEAIYTTDKNGTAPLEEVGSVFLPPGQQPWGCLGKAGWNTALYHTMTVSWQSLARWLLDRVDTVKFQKWCLCIRRLDKVSFVWISFNFNQFMKVWVTTIENLK